MFSVVFCPVFLSTIGLFGVYPIPNFNSLIPMSQTANKPVFLLTSSDGIVGAHFSKVREYENVMENIVSNLLHNIEGYD